MANWHVRALMERRKDYESDVYLKDFDIAMAVAIHIGEDDRPAIMSISKIAMMAGCHYNTADKRTKALAAAGKLVIGPGDGKLLAYSLPFEAVRSRHDERPPAQEPAGNRTSEIDALRQEVAELRGIVETLTESVKQLHAAVTSSSHSPSHDPHTDFTPSSHSHHTDVTSHQSDYVKEVEKKKRREEGHEYAHVPARESVIGGFSVDTDLHEPFDPDAYEEQVKLEQMISAISKEVRDTLAPGKSEEEFKSVALGLMAEGYGPADVKGFNTWWQVNSWYKNSEMISLNHLLKHFKSFKAGVSLRPASPPANGNGHAPTVLPSRAMLSGTPVEGEF